MTYEGLCQEAKARGWRVQLVRYQPRMSPKRQCVGHVLRLVDEHGVMIDEHWVGDRVTLDEAAAWVGRTLGEVAA
jgi:hypothetical protein